MNGEEHMKFTWSYELVGHNAIVVLIGALQKSAKEKDGRYVIRLDDSRQKFSKLYGFVKEVSSKHFNEPIRLLRKSGIIWIEKGKETRDVISARAGTEFEIDKDVLNVDVDNEKDVFNYVAKRTYDFHIPFKLLIDTINEHSNGIHKEVLRELFSEKMLSYAKKNYPDYFADKKAEMETRKKPVEKWRYSLAHFKSLLAIADRAGWISHKAGMIQKARKEEEAKVTYQQFQNALLDEYNRIIKQDIKLLMVSIDKLRASVCKRLNISEETFEKMMQTLVLRNLDKIKVYRQKAEEREKGLRMPDNLRIYAITVKGENLT
jgi:hypothetical protein